MPAPGPQRRQSVFLACAGSCTPLDALQHGVNRAGGPTLAARAVPLLRLKAGGALPPGGIPAPPFPVPVAVPLVTVIAIPVAIAVRRIAVHDPVALALAPGALVAWAARHSRLGLFLKQQTRASARGAHEGLRACGRGRDCKWWWVCPGWPGEHASRARVSLCRAAADGQPAVQHQRHKNASHAAL